MSRPGPAPGWAPATLLGLRRRWRRSLQLRVVSTTMFLGLVVILALGTLLLQRIQSGLVQERLTQAQAEADRGLVSARALLNTAHDSTQLNLVANQVVRSLASPGPDSSRSVIMVQALDNPAPEVLPRMGTPGVDTRVIDAMRERVVRTGQQEEQFVRIRRGGADSGVPGIAIGSLIALPGAGQHELYFVFTLQREQETIDMVRRSLVWGGLALVLLVGGVAYVVTRQVVRPVRQAAMVAQRLSSGRLQERMVARGEDDLARLAASFNVMAQNLQTQISQLENLSHVQQRFVSDVSHELRTPLTTIRMASDVLFETRADFAPAVSRSVELLQTQLDRFESLLADLLEISRIDAGGDLLDLEPVDLRDIAARVVENASPLAAKSGSVVTVDLSGAPVVADVDARRIERILRNLVVNALEHGEGRPVEVSTGGDEHGVAVAVRDHGVGLRPGEASLVFNRFWRADPSRARTIGGTGLGLSIAVEDARLHGGWLQAWGEPGQGSCFRLTLPRKAGGELASSPLPLAPELDPAVEVGRAYQRLRSRPAAVGPLPWTPGR